MINMIEKNGIISMHIHEGKSKREISRILRISRNTVDKYINEYEMNLKALKESEHDYESQFINKVSSASLLTKEQNRIEVPSQTK